MVQKVKQVMWDFTYTFGQLPRFFLKALDPDILFYSRWALVERRIPCLEEV
jgi:hypothetical protein